MEITNNNFVLDEAALKNSIAEILSIKSNKQILASELTNGKRVNEEELYSAINYGILNKYDTKIGEEYLNNISSNIENLENTKYSFEELADGSLEKLKNSGKISCNYLLNLLSFSLGKSSLDSNIESLDIEKSKDAKYDDTPLRTLGTVINKFSENESVSLDVAQRIKSNLVGECEFLQDEVADDIGETGPIYLNEYPKDFVWRPESFLYKKLAVFLPSEYQGRIKRLALYNSKGERLEVQNKYNINSKGQVVFHFKQAGNKYPNDLEININLWDERNQRITIPKTSEEIRG